MHPVDRGKGELERKLEKKDEIRTTKHTLYLAYIINRPNRIKRAKRLTQFLSDPLTKVSQGRGTKRHPK